MKYGVIVFLGLSFLTACGTGSATGVIDTSGGVADTSTTSTTPPMTCVSDSWWTGGNRESPLMRPGGDCVGCHASSGEGPRYEVGGTVYTNYDEPNDCNGVNGAVVVITDANGAETRLTANSAGNFFQGGWGSNIAYPYTARVEYNGGVIAMATPQTDGNCATCHTGAGANGAAGRIVIP